MVFCWMFCHLKLKSKMVICAAAVMNEVSRRLIISHGRQFFKKMFVRKIWIVFVGFYSLEWWFSDENRDRAWWFQISPRVFLLPTCGYVLLRSAICAQNNFWYFKKFWNPENVLCMKKIRNGLIVWLQCNTVLFCN